ncbi:MAG TPA: LuxR family transcriptional regulator, partial [Hyphomonas sp.]|nr:LuxR family transcriptional regulator [Hyphomonas sp.]HCJ17176.1 LuxR family transcriptional regulator [Hyphomonas sp.]HCN93863.1 LuxR family transcriptional regulator [Hyphomonas sp.]
QCLKWAAIGKTDSEIATIMGISVPTIRFHLTNAGQKLSVSGRAQAVRVATSLGYIGRSA